MWTVGDNKHLQLGQCTTSIAHAIPKKTCCFDAVALPLQQCDRIVEVSCGWSHVLALSARGVVFSWGRGGHGQQGARFPGTDAGTPHVICVCERIVNAITCSRDTISASEPSKASQAASLPQTDKTSAPEPSGPLVPSAVQHNPCAGCCYSSDENNGATLTSALLASKIACGAEHNLVLRSGMRLYCSICSYGHCSHCAR